MSGRYWPPSERIQITLDPDVVGLLRDIIASKSSTTNDAIALLRTEITHLRQEIRMSGTSLDQAIQTLTAQVQADTNATSAAVAAINGIPAMIQTAVDAALAAGATPQQLQAITDLGNTIGQNASDLGAAVTANTPASAPPVDAGQASGGAANQVTPTGDTGAPPAADDTAVAMNQTPSGRP